MFIEPTPIAEILVPLLPDIGLLIVLLLVLSIDLFTSGPSNRSLGVITAVGLLVVMAADLAVGFGLGAVNNPDFTGPALGGMLVYDQLSLIFRTAVLLGGSIAALISLNVEGLGRSGEYYAILVAATLGLTLMAGAGDLMMVFLALETASISLYVLAGFLRTNRQSTEAGIKYYLFGAFTSGLTLYGLSLLYGFSGTTNMYALADPLGNLMISGAAGQFNVIVALLLILVGFGFKISAVPFHFWTPDVYEGAPTPVTAFVSTASKAASFALLIRFFTVVWPPEAEFYWTLLLAVIAALTMTVGNVLALVQHNIKRMLAYSSVAQAGYALIGVVAMTQSPFGVAAVGFYMFMYVLTNLLAFSVVIAVNNQIGSDEIADYASLGWRSPYMAIALVIALLSLAGIPPAAGFFGKFFLFAAAVDAGFTWLAVVGVLNAIVALYYYLTVIKVMFVDPNDDMSPVPVALSYRTAMFISGAIVLVLGFLATPVFNWALQASTELVARLP